MAVVIAKTLTLKLEITFYLLLSCPMAHFRPMSSKQLHQPGINYCILGDYSTKGSTTSD